MWNVPSKEQLSGIPRLYVTEGIKAPDKVVHAHFFMSSCDWYVVEFDGNDTFFGYVILNNDHHCAEWGYFSFSQLRQLSYNGIEVDYDLHWQPCPFSQLRFDRG